MKRLMLTVAAVAAVMGVQAADVVKGGKPVAVVRTGESPNGQIAFAAQELTNWVAQITGAAIPVDGGAKAGVEICLGTPATSKAVADYAKGHAAAFAKIGDSDGFVIDEAGGKVFIAGNKTKGVLNGIYWFLTENSDLIFARGRDFGTVFTKKPDFANALKNYVKVPSLTHHRYWRGDDLWQCRLGANLDFQVMDVCDPKRLANFSRMWDGTKGTLGLSLGLVDKYNDDSVLPLLPNGKRDKGFDHHLCFMNPKSAEYLAKEAVAILRKSPKEIDSVYCGLADGWAVCTCKEFCSSPIDCGGGVVVKPEDKNFRSTQYAIFVTRVDKLIRAELPYVKPLATGMYLFLTEPPAVIPESKSSGCYCPYVKNHKKPVYDDSVNKGWHDRAEGFYKMGMGFESLYEYYLCTTTPKFYHAVDEVMQLDLKYYMKHGLTGCYLDTCAFDSPQYKDSDEWVLDVSAIEFWTAMRLMWDVDCDLMEVRHEYCRRAFREAGEIMFGFYRKLAENYNADSAGCFWNDDPVSACQHYVVEKDLAGWVRETLAKADVAAKHPNSKILIGRLREKMEKLVAEAETKPRKVTLAVGKDWTPVAPLAAPGEAQKPAKKGVGMWVKNDNTSLSLKMVTPRKGYREIYEKAKKEGTLGKTKEVLDWCNCAEMFIDGGLAASGGYYHFAINFDGDKFVGIGPAPDPQKMDWSYEVKPEGEGLCCIITWPLASIGVDISKGNKVGAMFMIDYAAWNGGQQNSPTGFQTLQLNMD